MISNFEKTFSKLIREDKIIYYDIDSYSKFDLYMELENDYPSVTFDRSLIENLPDIYFFGINIKDYLNHTFSNGRCHLCSFLLSLCFPDCKIVNGNLKEYVKHNNLRASYANKWHDFNHSFIVVNINNVEYVIDSTFGFIVDFASYKELFDLKIDFEIDGQSLKSNNIYNYCLTNKNNHIIANDNEINKFINKCQNFKSDNNNLQIFLSEYILYSLKYLSNDELNYFIDYINKKKIQLNNDAYYLLLQNNSKTRIRK